MAFYCRECKLIFNQKYPNCPLCGDRVFEDSRPDIALVSEGYTLRHANNSSRRSFDNPSSPTITIDSDDELQRLRRDFINRYPNDDSNLEGTDEPDNNTYGPVTDDSAANRQNTGGFFANPTADQYRINPERNGNPTVTPTPNNNSFNDRFEFNDAQPRRRNRIGRRPFRAINIPWRLIFTLIIIVFVIMMLVAIWNARHIIIDALISLCSTVITIVLIFFAAKTLFKK